MRLEKQATKSGCTSYFIMVDGDCKGTVQKCSYYHKGYQTQCTWYIVWMGEKINLAPNLHWPAHNRRLVKGVKFKQELDTDTHFGFTENGHAVRKRMLDWIKQSLAATV